MALKILFANKYFFLKSGVERVMFDTATLLEAHGHSVSYFSMRHAQNRPSEYTGHFVDGVDYERPGMANALAVSAKLLYSREARRRIDRLIAQVKPDVVHLHNIYHQISPSIIHSIRKAGIPLVMTIHDCKLVCPSYSMLSRGEICERCRGGRYYHCFLRRCVKGSAAKSMLNTLEMYLHHRIMNIYGGVGAFISPSLFLKGKFKEMGFRGPIVHLPNFINTRAYEPRYTAAGNTLAYVGRLSHEKGLFTLLTAMAKVPALGLSIIGDGPLRPELEKMVAQQGLTKVRFLGYLEEDELKKEVGGSLGLVLPSECYENNPRCVIEAFALGKPVIGARLGGIPELVRDGENGRLFEAGNAEDLAEKIKLLAANAAASEEMGRQGRRFVEERLNEESHYQKLVEIYHSVI